MRKILVILSHIFLISIIFFCFSFCATEKRSSNDPCFLPKDLKKKIGKIYNDYVVVNIDYLNEYNRMLYLRKHRNECPGLVKLNFYGDNSLTFAILLYNNIKKKPIVKLIIATKKVNENWKIMDIDETDGFVMPVVVSVPPGEFIDLYQEKKLKTKYDNIIFMGYESWAILYSWQDSKIDKIWLSD